MKAILIVLLVHAAWVCTAQENKHAMVMQVNSIPQRNPHGYNPFGGYWDEQKDLYTGPNIRTKDRSISTGLMYYQYRKGNMAMRVRGGIIYSHIKAGWTYTDASFRYKYEAYKKELDYYLAPGASMIFTVGKFSYFAGAELPFTLYGPASVYKHYSYSTINTGDIKYSNETTGSYSNGWSAGLGAFGGFSVKIHNTFTFGPEAGFAFVYSNYGKKGEFTSVTKNGTDYTENLRFSKGYSEIGISGLQGSLNFSYWF